MVYSVTLNPCLDYSYTLDRLETGAVNRAKGEQILCGGKGINVSVVLTNLGVDNTALGFVGGFVGDEIVRLVEKSGTKADFVKLNSGISRICFKIKAETESEVNGVGPDIPKEALEKFYSKLEAIKADDYLVLAGSIPGSLPDSIYKDISERLKNRNINIIVDSTGKSLLGVLDTSPFLIKPNHHELGELFGVKITSESEAERHALKLREMGARNVLVSMAEQGALLSAENGIIYKIKAPVGRAVNSVGAGDSMVAGFLAGWIETGDYAHALKMGVCAGSASAFSEFLAVKEDVERLYEML